MKNQHYRYRPKFSYFRAPKLVDCQPSLSHSASAHFDDTQSDGCGAASQVFEFSQRLICPSISDKVFLASPDPEKSVDNVSYSSPATPQQFADSHCTTSENANSMTRRYLLYIIHG
ncbi:hypothetical protein AB6A40_010201 [Gnathostoma spinigerum]|uniref:Uncharacterized protein n=1 Tax=Gnathostoma spinigerum TaxID=75299 RepID=A0ABD6F213_9BILA